MRLIRQLAKLIDASDLSFRDKYRMRISLFNRDIRKTVQEQLEAGASDNDARADLGLGPLVGSPKSIDWENFDWEAAKEFWIELIQAIAEIILAVI